MVTIASPGLDICATTVSVLSGTRSTATGTVKVPTFVPAATLT